MYKQVALIERLDALVSFGEPRLISLVELVGTATMADGLTVVV